MLQTYPPINLVITKKKKKKMIKYKNENEKYQKLNFFHFNLRSLPVQLSMPDNIMYVINHLPYTFHSGLLRAEFLKLCSVE